MTPNHIVMLFKQLYTVVMCGLGRAYVGKDDSGPETPKTGCFSHEFEKSSNLKTSNV